jgi:two-component system nitrate/nitrite response regulator NarL
LATQLTAAVADAVRRLRDERGWTARELAEACLRAGAPSLTRATIAKIESGVRKSVTADELAVLARVLGVSSETLLGNDRDARAVTVGIVATLPVEIAAVDALMTHPAPITIRGDPTSYRVGYLASADPDRPHRVVLASPDSPDGVVAACTNLLRSFPGTRCVISVGVGSGVSSAGKPGTGVRLGDVVVATKGAYEFHGMADESVRRGFGGVSAELVRAAEALGPGGRPGEEEWRRWLSPADDRLLAVFAPPADTGRRPRVHFGAVGSGDVLLDQVHRERFFSRYGIRAVEMEGSGVAPGVLAHGVGWFVVRGISDFGDLSARNTGWLPYAALVAAAYVRGVLEASPPFGAPVSPAEVSRSEPPEPTSGAIVRTMASSGRVIRVAVLDDHPIARYGLAHLMEAASGIEVVASADTAAGLREARPDVVLQDLYLVGDEPSLATVAEVAGFAGVLVVSASVRPVDVLGAVRSGASGYLGKNADVDSMVAAVRTVAAGGFALSPALADILQSELSRPPAKPTGHAERAELSMREQEVLSYLARGFTHAQTATRMGISKATVDTFVERIRAKLQLGSRASIELEGLRQTKDDRS